MILWRHSNSSYPSTSAPLTSAPLQQKRWLQERCHMAYYFQSHTKQSPGMCSCIINPLLLRGCISWFKGITMLPFANLCLNRETNRSLLLTSLDLGLNLAMTPKYICKLSCRFVFPGWPLLFSHRDFFFTCSYFLLLCCAIEHHCPMSNRELFSDLGPSTWTQWSRYEIGEKRRQAVSKVLEKIKSVQAETMFALCYS